MREGVRLRWHDFALDDEGIDAGLLSWERSFTEQFLPPNARILVIGCGSGRDVIAWARQGHHVVGIDPAAAAIAAGRAALTARGLAAELLDGFFEDRPWAPAFDAVSFSYYTYCYIPDSSRRVAALRQASAALRAGGHILVNIFPRPGSERLAFLGSWAAKISRNDWIPVRGDNTPVLAGTDHLIYEHYFDQEELEREFSAAHLQVVARFSRGEALVLRPVR